MTEAAPMERTIFSFAYKGSIPNAIDEARRKKKLFVVYISCDNESSAQLEQSTLQDQNVAEAMTKCCIFLHLVDGSVEASQFSAIYPQNSSPSLTLVGLNGVILWNHEGYITAEYLKNNIEKAWAAFHLQEFASALSTLSSGDPQLIGSTSTPSANGQSSIFPDDLDRSSEHSQPSSGGHADDSEILVKQLISEPSGDNDLKIVDHENIALPDTTGVRRVEIEMLDAASQSVDNNFQDDAADVAHEIPDIAKSKAHSDKKPLEKGKAAVNRQSENSESEASAVPTMTNRAVAQEMIMESAKENKPTKNVESTSSSSRSEDIYLCIRMPNSSSLQVKLNRKDTFSAVKNFVENNQGSGFFPYDLAVPFPRKIFTEQDMDKTLLELGFTNREALIVIPRNPSNGTSLRNQPETSNNDGTRSISHSSAGSYFSYVKKVLSFINPLAYLSGNSSSSPKPAAPFSSPQQASGAADDTTGGNTGKRGKTARAHGANIRTLHDDEEEDSPSDRNLFWNGNSTQFGGDDRK